MSNKRRAYRISSRKGRGGAVIDANEEGEEDWGSEDDDEGLDRRLARLIREAQEVQSELDRRKDEGQDEAQEGTEGQEEQSERDEADVTTKLKELNLALDKIRDSQADAGSAHAMLARQLSKQTEPIAAVPDLNGGTSQVKTSSEATATDSATLEKVAQFDSRLASIEKALGVSPLDTSDTTSTFNPILPTLSLLDKQVNLLSSVPSQPHLDSIIQKLQQAQASQHQQTPIGNGDPAATSANLTQEDMAKLRSLYAILPTLTNLAPALPPLLARLRSLRTLHGNAATASQTLDEIEHRQDEADKEIKDWTEGLAKVADAVKSAEGGMRENLGAVDTWVKDLEERVKRLA